MNRFFCVFAAACSVENNIAGENITPIQPETTTVNSATVDDIAPAETEESSAIEESETVTVEVDTDSSASITMRPSM